MRRSLERGLRDTGGTRAGHHGFREKRIARIVSSLRPVVVVTGSSGLIGSALIRALAGRYEIVGFDRAGPPHPPPEAHCVTVDLTSDESVRNAFVHLRADYGRRVASVVHLAAYYDFSGAPSEKYDAVTVGGTERLLREIGEEMEVEQFIFSSTMLVHAPSRPGRRITEDSPLDPKWPYPISKVKTEALIRDRRGRVPSLILRVAGVYDELCHSIPLAQQISRVYERRLTGRVFPGHLDHGQSFVRLDDTVDLLLRAIERRASLPPELTLLVGEPETWSYGDLQRELGRLIHGVDWTTRRMPKALAKMGAWVQNWTGNSFIKPWMIDLADQHYELDISRARSTLGWEPRHRLWGSLPAMVDALKRDPERWYRENGLAVPRRAAG
jgi:nucleoside-diphosphate-sugar epimerase